MVPEENVADNVTEPSPHRDAGVADVIVGRLFTVTSTGVRTEVQLPSTAST